MTKWVRRWKYEMSAEAVRPGVWKLKTGGHYVRARVKDPCSGRMREISSPLPDESDADGAYEFLRREVREVREGGARQTFPTKFGDYGLSLLARKIRSGDLKSAKSREQWGYVLEHHLLPEFGQADLHVLKRAMVEDWKDRMARLVQKGEYSPVTFNYWLKIGKVIGKAAKGELELKRDPFADVTFLDTSTHSTYTDEEPNSLTPDEVPVFLAGLRRLYPQHFAMVALGFATGLRPSTLRPIRRKGSTPDVLWEPGVVLVRRSHTMRDEVMDKPKTGLRQRLSLPKDLMEILEWHAGRLPEGKMKESDLLFPSETGGFRAPSCLDKPFRAVAEATGFKKHLTPRSMRRSYQDLARAAEVQDIVTRAVSGHATEAMQQHYSTVSGEEMRRSLAKVISLAKVKEALGAAESPPSTPAAGDDGGEVVG